MSTPAKSLSRRDFLRLFTRSAAQSVGEAVSAVVPPPGGMRRERRRTRPQPPGPVEDSTERQALCALCCAAYPAADDSPYCPDCRAQQERNASVLASLGAERIE